ncbi:MAG: SRPBCC domain-containing protein [Myxococcota bacterium]
MSAPGSVVVTTRVDVDRATAFAVFTEDVDAWWRSGQRFRVDPERQGRMCFEPGVGGRLVELYDPATGEGFEHGKVSVWDPPARLVFEMRGRDFGAGESTEVEVRFEVEDGMTRVTVEHRGWERFPEDHPVRHGLDAGAFRDVMSVWWADLLASVNEHVRSKQRAPGGSR